MVPEIGGGRVRSGLERVQGKHVGDENTPYFDRCGGGTGVHVHQSISKCAPMTRAFHYM